MAEGGGHTQVEQGAPTSAYDGEPVCRCLEDIAHVFVFFQFGLFLDAAEGSSALPVPLEKEDAAISRMIENT